MYVLAVPPTVTLRDVLPRMLERVPQLSPEEEPPSTLDAPAPFELPPHCAAARGSIDRKHNEPTRHRLLMRISQERSADGARRPSLGGLAALRARHR